jgi:glycosyltransferase involved in cell wall biosynthesis
MAPRSNAISGGREESVEPAAPRLVGGLSVVIPAYNEEANIGSTIDRVSRALQSLGVEYEIIAVNDGSRDRTGEVVRALLPRVPNLRLVEHTPNRGYGGSLKAGFRECGLLWIAFLPGDNQFDPAELALLIARTRENDIVSGYREDRQDPFVRRLNAFGWNMVVRLVFGRLCRDVDCGFKLFRRDLLDRVTIESNGAMIDTELLAGARARGAAIGDVRVTHLPRTAGHPTGANARVIVKAFRDLIRFRLRLWRELRSERGRR